MPTSRVCCIDAGIVVRLLLDSGDHPARALWDDWQREQVSIIAPSLLFYEVTNALYQQQRHGYLSVELVSLMIRTAYALPIKLYSDSDLHHDAHRLASEIGLPATYDAHYLVTAERNKAAFWTADVKLVDKIGGRWEWVNLLPREHTE